MNDLTRTTDRERLYLARAQLADAEELVRESKAKVSEAEKRLTQAGDRIDEAERLTK